jgi:hypothetical protein
VGSKPSTLKINDVVRAKKAAVKAGMPDATIEFTTNKGETIRFIPTAAKSTAASSDPDQALEAWKAGRASEA